MAGKKVHPNSVQGRKRRVVLRSNNVLSNTAKTIPAAGLENVNRRQGLSMGRQIQAPSGVGIALRGLGKAAGPVAAVLPHLHPPKWGTGRLSYQKAVQGLQDGLRRISLRVVNPMAVCA
jgi:hypothetical protein